MGHLENIYIPNSFTCGLPTKTLSGFEHWNRLCKLLCVGRNRNGATDSPFLTNVIKLFPHRFLIPSYFCLRPGENESLYVHKPKAVYNLGMVIVLTLHRTFKFSIFSFPYICSQELQYIELTGNALIQFAIDILNCVFDLTSTRM